MDWQEKAWGRTKCLINADFFSRHELEVIAGGFCSYHYHEQRANRFRILSGKIRVLWSIGNLHSQVLTVDNVLDIPSLVPHQFQVLESGVLLEDYWPDRRGKVFDSDIVRLSQGGRIYDMASLNAERIRGVPT